MSEPSDWLDNLNSLKGVSVHRDRDLHHHTPMRVGGPVDAWVRCNSTQALEETMSSLKKTSWRIHWPFEDWLVKNGGLTGIVLRLEGAFEQLTVHDDYIEMGSAVLWSSLKSIVPFGCSKELHNWSGSVGSALLSEQASTLFSGFKIEVEWLQGKRRNQQCFDRKTPLVLPTKCIPIVLRIYNSRSPRKTTPVHNGRIFTLSKQQPIAETLSELSLNGVRLRDWKISHSNPDCVVHLGKGHIEDVQLLLKALNQRLKPARNLKLSFRRPPFGRS